MQPPQIDPRDIPGLIAQMKEMAPYYTPEWRFTPDDPDPGSALFLMFADMFHENIKRLNRVPTKNLVSFLNMFDVSLLPARPASAYVTFALNEGTKEPVLIPAGTQIAAAGEAGPLFYETARSALLTPAALHAAYASSRSRDAIIRIADAFITASRQGQAAPTALFRIKDGDNLQAHALFLEHSSLFTVPSTARIELEIRNSKQRYDEANVCSQLADPELTEWLYAAEDGWRAFDRVEAKGTRIILTKAQLGELAEREVDGIAGHWIQCRLKPIRQDGATLADRRLSMDQISAKTDYADVLQMGGIKPEQMFYNDIQADESGFYPFGDQFALYGSFYIASREVFTKKDSDITLSFDLQAVQNRFQPEAAEQVDWKLVMKKSKFDKPAVVHATVMQVVWEYWNGATWVRLEVGKEAEKLFYYPQEQPVRKQVRFRCPQDLEPTYVNGNESWWIRARILQMENAYAPQAVYLSPWVEHVGLTYGYEDRVYPPHCCLTLNNTVYADRTRHSRCQEGGFEPFQPLEGEYPSLYLGFDAPPVKGPISLYVSVKRQRLTGQDIPMLEWEYLRGALLPGSPAEWAPLKVIDGTNGLTQSGALQFAGPSDFAEAVQFGSQGYWIRVVNRDGKYDDPDERTPVPVVHGIYLNTVQALQQETITGEVPDARGIDETEYQLNRSGIVSEDVWVDETDYVTEEEIAEYERQGEPVLDVKRDSEGHVQRLWIKWASVSRLADSGGRDRHYTLDRTFGRLRFGDGIHGKKPPKGGLDQIKVTYQVTSGQAGNVDARQINRLQDSIAFVGEVYNPEPAAGGCEAEQLDSALRRGPEMIRHRGRAVTAEDYEWLAREAYPNIAKVKCVPNHNAYMQTEPGAMTLVILPKEGRQGSAAFPELKKQVEKYMMQRASGLVAFPGNIQVIEPVYMEISVSAAVAVEGMDAVVSTELQALDKLNRFLDPLTGNFDGKGWKIGQQIHPSVFYALLKSIRAVNHVEKLYMTVFKLEDGERQELDVNRLPAMPHGIVVSGKHKVTVRVL